jgi:hypothetical protein
MPGLDGTGPAGAGAMSGRGLGACAGGRSAPWGLARGGGRGFGYGRGPCVGFGRGMGLGRRMGWFSVGYGEPGDSPAVTIRNALEERKAFLRAELERTEALLKDAGSGAAQKENEEG